MQWGSGYSKSGGIALCRGLILSDNHVVFILQRRCDALDKIEQAVASRLDMSTVLDVVGRPIAFSRYAVTLIDKSQGRFATIDCDRGTRDERRPFG